MKPKEQRLFERLSEISDDMLSYGEMMDNSYIRLKGAELEAVVRAILKEVEVI